MEVGIPQSWRSERERYLLIGTHCESCGSNYFPARKICPKCRRKGKISEKKFSGNGTVYSYTVVYVPPTGFKLKIPYVLAIIKLDEGPNVMGIIEDVNSGEIKIGSRVKQIFRKWIEEEEGGLIHYGFAFRLVK